MLRREVGALRRELREMSGDVEKLKMLVPKVANQMADGSENVARHINKLYRLLASIEISVGAVIDMTFPKFAATKRQIDSVLKKYGVTDNLENLPEKPRK